jgi:sigma-E factor negative regulatory protein RseA
MTKETLEHLSSLMDGEISRETSQFLVRRLGADGELRETWARYHVIRDSLRYQDGDLASNQLCGRVREAIESDALPEISRRISMGWLKPVAGAAIAASVALMAITMVAPGRNAGLIPETEVAGAPETESFASPNILSHGPRSQPVNLSSESAFGNKKMNSYFLRHYQVAGNTGGKGFVTFVPIIVTKASEQTESEDQSGDEDESSKGDSERR